jgi:hypothetical protein
MAQNGKYLGNYIAKVEVVGGSPHSFLCWKTPRKSYFNGSKTLSQTNETAFTFMYSHTRNPYPTDISLDTKTFLTPLRNYYTPRGNTFYNIELGKDPSPIIQVQINYNSNIITVKEGSNFKLNLLSSLFRGGDIVTVVEQGKRTQYRLQKDINYAMNNMKLFCDPNYGFDSYVTVGNFKPEVNVGYSPQPPQAVSGGQTQSQIPHQVMPGQGQYPQVIPAQGQYQQVIPAQSQYQQPIPGYPMQVQPSYGQFSSRLGYQQYQQPFGMQGQMGYPQQYGNYGRQMRPQYGGGYW